MHQRHVHPQEDCRLQADAAGSSSTSIWTAWKNRTTWPWSAKGVFDEAVDGIKVAKEHGFLVCTNTTVYKETDMHEIAVLLAYLTELGVDGFMMSPAYGYDAVQATNPDGAQQIFMTRDDVHAKFREAKKLLKRFQAEHVADLSGISARRARAATAPPGRIPPAISAAGRAPAI